MSTYQEAVEKTIVASEQLHQIVNGTATTEIVVEDGSNVPSIRKALLDNFYFKDPLSWQQGTSETIFNQLRKFTDGSWWYSPSATQSNPTSMGTTPFGDPLWKIYDFDAIGKLEPRLDASLRRSYTAAGYNLVAGSFEAGGVLVNDNDVLIQKSTGKGYTGPAGTVVSGTDPTSGGFTDRSLSVYGVTTTSKLASGMYSAGAIVKITDRGGATAVVQAGGVVNGETILNAGTGRTAIIDAKYYGDVETYSSIQAALNNVKSLGIKVLSINSDITSSTDPNNKGAVAFIGNGSVSGVYRKRVAKVSDQGSVAFNDINPDAHLKRFLSKTSPIVVVVGDSISTETGANVPTSDSLYNRICNKLSTAFPDKTISFHNRAIGGENYLSAVGLPSNFPTWYTDQSRSWLRYVGDLNPDLVIFNFGMNDSSNLHNNALTEYIGYMQNVSLFPAGVPDIIYCTNLTPSIDSTFANYNSEAGQSGRDHVAGFTRSFAKSVGAGLLDFHRQCTIVKDGYDPTDTYLEKVGSVVPSNGAVSSIEKCTDFKWELTLSLPAGSNMAIRLGSPPDTAIDPIGRGSYVVVANSGGVFKCDFFYAVAGNPASVYGSLPANGAVPSGSFTLTVEKKQNTFLMSVGGLQVARYDKLRVGGADVQAKAGDATYTNGPITSAVFYAGRYKTYKQSIINDDMWGTSDNLAVQRQPFGGNGANHPSSIGISAVFQPVLDNANLSGRYEMTSPLVLMNGWRDVQGKLAQKAYRNGKYISINFAVQVPVTGVAAKGVVLNVPSDFRPPAGSSVYAVMQNTNATQSLVQCDLSSNGDIQIYQNVDNIAYGVFNFVLP